MDGTPTTGRLYYDGDEIFTLELPWLDNQKDVSCIPAGTYTCQLLWSNRFQKIMPRLLFVPERDGILIHPGNTEANTEGCILVGTSLAGNSTSYLLNSRDAFVGLYDWLLDGGGKADCVISVAGE